MPPDEPIIIEGELKESLDKALAKLAYLESFGVAIYETAKTYP